MKKGRVFEGRVRKREERTKRSTNSKKEREEKLMKSRLALEEYEMKKKPDRTHEPKMRKAVTHNADITRNQRNVGAQAEKRFSFRTVQTEHCA